MDPIGFIPSITFLILSMIYPEMNHVTQNMISQKNKTEMIVPKKSHVCRSVSVRSSRQVIINGKEIENSNKEWGSPGKCLNSNIENMEIFPPIFEINHF